MSAFAYANNDMAIIQWKYDHKIDDCLGFCIEREFDTGETQVLGSWVGFSNQANENWKQQPTTIWPVQKFNWKDLTAPKQSKFRYRIIPMIGTPGNLKQAASSLQLETNYVELTPGTGTFKAYFNRGILSTQALGHELQAKYKNKGSELTELKEEIEDVNSPIRKSLSGDITAALLTLLNKASEEGGTCYAALYELTDPELIQHLIDNKNNVRVILTNADTSISQTGSDGKKHSKKVLDGENAPFRKQLKDAGVTVYDRFVPSGHIGHNKFMVYLDKVNNPEIVLSGSTNWTPNGMCAQSNNAIIITHNELAQFYYDYWNRLLKDTQTNSSRQGATLRTSDQQAFTTQDKSISVWFSPNTTKSAKPKPASGLDIDNDPNTPGDIKELFNLMDAATKSILFLEFQPGYPSVLDKILEIQEKNPQIFIRGAATDSKAIGNYNTALYHGKKDPDFYNVVAASAIKDQFAYWEKELLSAGHAIIHDKIIVIDAFTDNCIVATGSHNQGYKASYCNDENLLIIKGNQDVAHAYAAHVIDVYDHYRWRYTLTQKGTDENGNYTAFSGLETDDSWQNKYFQTSASPGTHPSAANTSKPTKDVTYPLKNTSKGKQGQKKGRKK